MTLDPAQRAQLERDLTDLPDLADQLARHYDALLSRGERGYDDPDMRYPTRFAVLDLAHQRPKDGWIEDPASEATIARDIGARRLGILPTLVAWVSDLVATIDTIHITPSDPQRVRWIAHPNGDLIAHTGWEPNIERETHWIRAHLDQIVDHPDAEALANEIRDIVRDLEHQVGPAYARPLPDHHVLATEADLSQRLHVPRSTIRNWINRDKLHQARSSDGRLQFDHAGRRVYFVVEAQALKVTKPRRRHGKRRFDEP